jgi:hypothetical protein
LTGATKENGETRARIADIPAEIWNER